MLYRHEIDGLRGVAVLAVIFYHAGFKFFSGGFIGVDIFFVISGYLITGILYNGLNGDAVFLKYFYIRRALRILPMLMFTLLVTLPFSWMWLPPDNLKEFGLSLIGGITFMSNFLDWKGGGYFSTASELKPLMHLWSLAIEEQFYLLYPLFILLAQKIFKKLSVKLFIIFIILGVIFSEILSGIRPQMSFFMLPSRFWELLAGGLVSLIYRNKKIKKYDEQMSIISLAILITAFIVINENTKYPGFATILPVLGTCGLLYYSTSKTIINDLLNWKIINIIGISSYSSYLIHQPVLAFSRLRLNRELNDFESCISIIFILSLSLICWKYIELRCRKYV